MSIAQRKADTGRNQPFHSRLGVLQFVTTPRDTPPNSLRSLNMDHWVRHPGVVHPTEVNDVSSLLVARNNTFVGVSPSLPPTMSGAVHRSESYQEDLGGPQSPQNLKEVRAVMPRVPTRTSHAFTIEVELNQKKTVSALLDSGATADFIDARLVAELRLKKYQLDTIGEIYLASEGVKVSVSTEVTLDLNCHGVKVRRGFFVYPQLTEPLVFGTPFMIDFAKFLNLSAQEFNGLPLNKRRPQVLSQVKRKSITHIDATRLERHCKSRDNEVFTLLVKLGFFPIQTRSRLFRIGLLLSLSNKLKAFLVFVVFTAVLFITTPSIPHVSMITLLVNCPGQPCTNKCSINSVSG